MRESEDQLKGHSFAQIFTVVPLYQIYVPKTQYSGEFKRIGQRFRESLRTRLSSRRKFSAQTRSASVASCPTPKIPNGAKVINDKTFGSYPTDRVGSVDVNSTNREKDSIDQGDEPDNGTSYVTQRLVGGPVGRCQWVDMPEVAKRGLARDLTSDQRCLLEARFEIITTEASFNKSLTFLIETFYKAAVFDTSVPNALLTPLDKTHLFSNIQDIHVTSNKLLLDLANYFQEDPLMKRICDILFEYSESKLSYYITYVRNQSYQIKMLEKIMSQPKLADELQRLQRTPACNGLDLNSFLVLPMQRIVRLRLLVIAVLKYTEKSSNAYRSGLLALASLEKLISECDAQTGYMEKKERLLTLSNQLEFQNSMRAIAMENRELVKEGNMNLIITPNANQAGTRRKISDVMRCKPTKMTLFLITDLLLITRPKGEKFYVVEVCPLEKIKASAEQLPPGFDILALGDQRLPKATDPADSGGGSSHHSHHHKGPQTRSNFERISIRSRRSYIIAPQNVTESSTASILEGNSGHDLHEFPLFLTVETAEGITRSYHLLADSLNSRERWLDLLRPGYNSTPEQTGGTQNVFRQVIATTSHCSTEGDEIEVREGDIMNVIVDLPDGWYKCALPDGRAGWIPKTICSELDDPMAHQVNLKSFELSKEASRVYEEMKRRDRGTVFQRLRAFFDNDL
ncbi:Rho guanine nucleotide exchange factor 26 [Sparganum proliferum]